MAVFILPEPNHVRLLFSDRKTEALRYYRKRGHDPIVHLVACQCPVIEAHPWPAQAIMRLWEDAKAQLRDCYDDPGYAPLAFARNEVGEQAAEMGPDRWPSGIKTNRANIEVSSAIHGISLIDRSVTGRSCSTIDLEKLVPGHAEPRALADPKPAD